MNHIELGKKGEEVATQNLIKNGYAIVERNYRWKNAEIDIICKKDNQLVIVEVKTRNSSVFGEPYKSVSLSKQRQIVKVANKFIVDQDVDLDVRFDVFSIVINKSTEKVQHIQNAFYPLL